MDTLTHALSGALAVRALDEKLASDPKTLRRLTYVGFLAAAAPDLDFVISLVSDDPMMYLRHHRGVTHSLLLLPLWAALLGGIFKSFYREIPFKLLYGLCAMAIGLHIVGDVITSYGTMIFAPLSNWRASLDTTFIIDPIFTGIIVLGLSLAFWHHTRRWAPRAASLCLLGYIGLQGWAHHQAAIMGTTWAKSLDGPAEVQVLPQPLSPFHWKVMVIERDQYHMSYLKLFGQPVPAKPDGGFLNRIAQIYQPVDRLQWQHFDRPDSTTASNDDIVQAWQHPALKDYRDFARYPVNWPTHEQACTWFYDLQFQLPGRINPFVFGLCSNPTDGRLQLSRFR